MKDILLDCSIRALFVAIAVAAIVGGLRIRNPRSRHRAWSAVLIAMLLLPAYSLWLPKLSLPLLPAQQQPPSIETPLPFQEPPTSRPTAAQSMPQVEPPPPFDVLLAVYLSGVGVLLARLLIGTYRATSFLKRATPEQEFLTSAECVCPITVGWLQPSIVLPLSWRDWPSDELQAVLAHEREHASRRDPLLQWLAALNRSIFWFHPLAWWLERKLAVLAEEACDAAVIENGCDPYDYSEYLLNQARALQRVGSRFSLHGATMGRGTLNHRLQRLLDRHPSPEVSRARAASAFALCSLSIALFTSLSNRPHRKGRPRPADDERTDAPPRRREPAIARQERCRARKGQSPEARRSAGVACEVEERSRRR